MILRNGIDKIMLTVRPVGMGANHPFPKRIYERYRAFDRVLKLKFGDAWAQVIGLHKYEWQPDSYAIDYMVRLNADRQMRVLVNLMRYYNIRNCLPIWNQRLHDDNVVIPSHHFELYEFVDLMKELRCEILNDYRTIRATIFNDEPGELTIDVHQIEVVTEAVGIHLADVLDNFTKFARADSVVRYYNQTATVYLNTTSRRQLKIYQKGVGLLRMEMTVNMRASDVTTNFEADTEIIVDSIEREIGYMLTDMNIPRDWWTMRSMNLDTLAWLWADCYELRCEDGSPDTELMKVLLTMNSWSSNKENRVLTQRLKRKGLICHAPRSKRTFWLPTERLKQLQLLFDKLERTKGLWDDQEGPDDE